MPLATASVVVPTAAGRCAPLMHCSCCPFFSHASDRPKMRTDSPAVTLVLTQDGCCSSVWMEPLRIVPTSPDIAHQISGALIGRIVAAAALVAGLALSLAAPVVSLI